MKNTWKNLLKKIPGLLGAKHLMGRKIHDYKRAFAQKRIDERIKKKYALGRKVNILFVCHRPAVWESLHSVYDKLCADERYRVTVMAIPVKKSMAKEIYESEGAEEYWKEYDCMNGYDYSKKEWLDIRSLEPDYVFFQQPYNVAMPKQYSSKRISLYAKLAYVSYFSPACCDSVYEDCLPLDFLEDLSFFFTLHEEDTEFVKKRFEAVKNHTCKIIESGFPRYDNVLKFKNQKCDVWNFEKTYKLIWTPRWTTNEGNCFFFAYKDQFIDLLQKNENLELVFRPHPQAFKEWEATGEMTAKEQAEFRKHFQNDRMHIDERADYFPLLFSSDCLITDRSSILVDYFSTKKPIVYCTNKERPDSLVKGYERGIYFVYDWKGLADLLQRLTNGFDPLKDAREDIYRNFLKIGKGNAGWIISETFRKDMEMN